ncbi:conserved protein of unknown function (plasmid) [Rhodovastum atsumiense]|uniref:Uncharacterized protein n=1 Tax=Rhodovastum atsumiense TaxID=504468 RepID=A0A5M6IP42_9PROT|nr:hypothetical protein [Rhodovastum atsumiense]KAA5609669.1 hypothetical protein F1189_23195 [Rhodovastum atsumiense]CAH2606432.1 conserved protein of unknown function [Rhodovastum atsumiense]
MVALTTQWTVVARKRPGRREWEWPNAETEAGVLALREQGEAITMQEHRPDGGWDLKAAMLPAWKRFGRAA